MLGIIGAMTEEVLHLKEAMEDVEIRTIATMDWTWSWYGLVSVR